MRKQKRWMALFALCANNPEVLSASGMKKHAGTSNHLFRRHSQLRFA
jgi:hypothetical protein